MLGEWELLAPKFRKVMPHDYKRALAEQAARAGDESPEAEPAPVDQTSAAR